MNKQISILALLQSLTKRHLTTIRQTVQLKGLSSLNKEELAIALAQQLPQRFIDIFHTFSYPNYQILKQVYHAKKDIPAEALDISFLQNYGILFIEDGSIVMPQEIRNMWHHLNPNTFEQYTEIAACLQGMTHVYGAIPLDVAHQRIEELYHLTIQQEDLDTLLDSLRTINGYIVHPSLDNLKGLIREQRKYPLLDYKPFSKDQLILCSEPTYVEQTPAVQALLTEIQKQHPKARQRDLQRIIIDIQLNKDHGLLLQNLISTFPPKDYTQLQWYATLLTEVINTTILWILKGHRAVDIFQQSPKNTDRKVSRNGPCPCGSEKKYKRCCG